jgi:hypothetical protein
LVLSCFILFVCSSKIGHCNFPCFIFFRPEKYGGFVTEVNFHVDIVVEEGMEHSNEKTMNSA